MGKTSTPVRSFRVQINSLKSASYGQRLNLKTCVRYARVGGRVVRLRGIPAGKERKTMNPSKWLSGVFTLVLVGFAAG